MKIYLVGGAIRNYFLNLPIQDKDWVVVGATAKILLKKNFQQVGKDFPVFLHPETHEEYALARQERKVGKGYTGFITNFHNNVTLEEDLIRRDLTINAIAQDTKGNYIDPFHGIQDIQNRLLRHVSEAFIEDPLRVLRVARFAATLSHLGFKIADETMNLMRIIVKSKELFYLTSHRIWNETVKALKTANPHVYFQVLYSCQALRYLFPEINYLYEKKLFINYSNSSRFNPFFFVCKGLAKLSTLTKNINIRFIYLCQFISNNSMHTVDNFYNKYSADIVYQLCNRLNVPLEIKKIASLSAGFYHFLKNINMQSSSNIVILFFKIDAWRKPDRVEILANLIDFNFCYIFSSKNPVKPGFFLKTVFAIINTISIQNLLDEGFQGHEIKKELIRLRIQKLELWRRETTFFNNYIE